MFGSTSPFGQSSTSPFGQTSFGAQQQGFGQASTNNPFGQKPFGSQTTPFGAQTGSSLFGNTSTGAFGQQQSTPTFGTPSPSPFGSSTPAFGASPTPAFGATSSTFGSGSVFGQKTSFGAFGSSPSQSSPFGSTFQQTQPAFGSNAFGATSTPGFGTTTTPAFGATTAQGFGTTTTPGFGASTTPTFGSTSTSLFGTTSAPTFGSTAFGSSTPGTGFGTSGTTTFGVSSGPGFGVSSTPTFGFGSSPSVGQTSTSFGTSLFGANTSPFGAQTSTFGSQPATTPFGQAPFGNQAGGSRIKPYAQTLDADSATSGAPAAKLDSISAMPEYKDKSHDELRWEDYQRGDKGGPNSFGTPAAAPQPNPQPNLFAAQTGQVNPNPFSSTPTNNPFAAKTSTGFGSTSTFSTLFNSSSAASSNPFTSSTNTTQFGQTAIYPSSDIKHVLLPTYNSTGTPSQSNMVMQPAPVSHPYGTLPAMPQMSIGNVGSSPSVQYGISSLPVAEKPLPSRTLSMVVPRHLSQRRIKLHPRKYNPISDGKVPFFADDEESPATPKADAFFVPRENPRNLIIRPIDQWPSRSGIDRRSVIKDSADLEKYKGASVENERSKASMSPSGSSPVENGSYEREDVTRHGNGASVGSLMPKLPDADYFTEPSLEELAAKERAEPGYCSHVRDFIVGHHGYGSIKFLGETDVRGLDLESILEFNNREVIVYKDDSKKPPVGKGLNKAAEVTLLNIKCMNKKTGEQYREGSRVDKYKEMLVKKAEEQGAEFVSFDAAKEEWKFRVKHFSAYGFW
ncbi:hypothetical protein EJB05_03482 [Eragrostis curvula]|uniref:Nucleoporin autopeptidase n=1 Tax=Eragrostis curvula TaxID=38414 RepID=A0A5J9W7Y1_9POAL|nr:hypothetical protein EJB05_03482 [Eragrostis curvula]